MGLEEREEGTRERREGKREGGREERWRTPSSKTCSHNIYGKLLEPLPEHYIEDWDPYGGAKLSTDAQELHYCSTQNRRHICCEIPKKIHRSCKIAFPAGKKTSRSSALRTESIYPFFTALNHKDDPNPLYLSTHNVTQLKYRTAETFEGENFRVLEPSAKVFSAKFCGHTYIIIGCTRAIRESFLHKIIVFVPKREGFPLHGI